MISVQLVNDGSRPNILWLTTHDINPHLGCYSGDYPNADLATTPNLDSLAAQGARFTNAFAAAPVCGPSRSSIVTGCYPTSIGTMHMRTKAVPPPEVALLPEYFRKAGYYTANTGFTDYQVVTPPPVYDENHSGAHWRNREDPDQPFFMSVHGTVTHESKLYLDEGAFREATPNVRDNQRHEPSEVNIPPYHPDTPEFRLTWARYYDLITEMDYQMGEWLNQLRADGLAENTLVVFWSDHGLGMPRAKRWLNDSGLHEPLLMRWPGRITPGTVRDDLVHLMDLAPTMLSVAGLEVPPHMHGKTLMQADGGFVERPNKYLFASRDRMDEQSDCSRSVRSPRYRYIRNYHPDRSGMQSCWYPDRFSTWSAFRRIASEEASQIARGETPNLFSPIQRSVVAATKPKEELYDLEADPFELNNIVGDPGAASVARELRGALSDWQERFGDLGLMDEASLIEEWRPEGKRFLTSPPTVAKDDTGRVVTCPTEGATIGWTERPPTQPDEVDHGGHKGQFGDDIGNLVDDGRAWRVLGEGDPLPSAPRIWLKAWRLGYEPSDEVQIMQDL